MNQRKLVDELTKKLMDDGKIIEAGWVSLCAMSMPKDAPPIQIEEMRNAFFAGAQHLWGSVMSGLEEDRDPTENDMRRMELIQKELDSFIKIYQLRHFPAGGNA